MIYVQSSCMMRLVTASEGTLGFQDPRGEENAWVAHSQLFTGPALKALTSETRGQNSWLNFGPHGEHNRTASLEDTIFADQKTGVMPSFTWTEGAPPSSRKNKSRRHSS
jgi:hypothetical protein